MQKILASSGQELESAAQSVDIKTVSCRSSEQLKSIQQTLVNRYSGRCFVVHNRDYLPPLLTQVLMQKESGKFQAVPGPLAPFVTDPSQNSDASPGVLILNFDEIPDVQWGPLFELFEDDSKLMMETILGKLKVYCLISEQRLSDLDDYPAAHRRFVNSETDEFRDLQQVQGPNAPRVTFNLSGFEAEGDVVDVMGRNTWRLALFGGPFRDEENRDCYRIGALEDGLSRGQTHFILKNFPNDPDIKAELQQIAAQNGLWFNGVFKKIPDLTFTFINGYSADQKKECDEKLNIISWDEPPVGKKTLRLYSDTLEHLIEGFRINPDNRPSVENLFMSSGAEAIWVDSTLTEHEWMQLAYACNDLPIFVGPKCNLPPFLQPHPNSDNHKVEQRVQKKLERKVNLVKTNDVDAYVDLFEPQQIELLTVTSQSTWGQHFQVFDILSYEKCEMRRQSTIIEQALLTGEKRVLIKGLASNPTMATLFRSLMDEPPYLIINGERVDLPLARVDFIFKDTLPDSFEELPLKHFEIEPEDTIRHLIKTCGFEAQDQLYIDELLSFFKDITPYRSDASLKRKGIVVPDLNYATLAMLFRQVKLEQAMDRSRFANGFHWEKAVNSSLIKYFRKDKELYSQFKVRCHFYFRQAQDKSEHVSSTNVEKAKHYLMSLPPTPASIDEHYWELCLLLGPSHFKGEKTNENKQRIIQCLSQFFDNKEEISYIQRFFGQCCDFVPFESPIDLKLVAAEEKFLRDLFYSLPVEQIVSLGDFDSLSAVVETLSTLISTEPIKHWRPIIDNLFLEKSKNIIDSINRYLKSPKEEAAAVSLLRRQNRFLERVRIQPATQVTGETSSGKSYTSSRAIRDLNKNTPDAVFETTLSTDTTTESLLGRQTLVSSGTDSKTVWVDGIVASWARCQIAGSYPSLLLHEANFANPNVFSMFEPFLAGKGYIVVHGEKVTLTPNHRLITTINDQSFGGRKFNATLAKFASPLTYLGFSNDVLRYGIVGPKLKSTYPSQEPRHRLMNQVLEEWKVALHRSRLQAVTLRDLNHIVEWLCLFPLKEINEESVKTAVKDAFYSVFGGVQNIKPPEPVKYKTEQLRVQIEKLQSERPPHKHLDFSNKVTSDYLHHLCSALMVVEKELDGQVFTGKHAMVIQGDPGAGKDKVLDAALEAWTQHINQGQKKKPFVHVTCGGSKDLNKLKRLIDQAKKEGFVVAISELNQLKTEEAESLLNDALDPPFNPGFYFFATVNSEALGNRFKMSPALLSRQIRVTMKDFDGDDFERMSLGWLSADLINSKVFEQLKNLHFSLLKEAKDNGISLLPVYDDFKGVLMGVQDKQFPMTALSRVVRSRYRHYLRRSKLDLDTLFTGKILQDIQDDSPSLSTEFEPSITVTEPFISRAKQWDLQLKKEEELRRFTTFADIPPEPPIVRAAEENPLDLGVPAIVINDCDEQAKNPINLRRQLNKRSSQINDLEPQNELNEAAEDHVDFVLQLGENIAHPRTKKRLLLKLPSCVPGIKEKIEQCRFNQWKEKFGSEFESLITFSAHNDGNDVKWRPVHLEEWEIREELQRLLSSKNDPSRFRYGIVEQTSRFLQQKGLSVDKVLFNIINGLSPRIIVQQTSRFSLSCAPVFSCCKAESRDPIERETEGRLNVMKVEDSHPLKSSDFRTGIKKVSYKKHLYSLDRLTAREERLSVGSSVFWKDGSVCCDESVDFSKGQLQNVKKAESQEELDNFAHGQVLGEIVVSNNGDWSPVPSYTREPQASAYMTNTDQELDFLFVPGSGLFARLKKPNGHSNQTVNVRYILKRKPILTWKDVDKSTLDKDVERQLPKEPPNSWLAELGITSSLFLEHNYIETIEKLINYFSVYSIDKLIDAGFEHVKEKMLKKHLRSIEQKKGNCFVRSLGFLDVAKALGIRAEVISNGGHAWVSVALPMTDGAWAWVNVDLGGQISDKKTQINKALEEKYAKAAQLNLATASQQELGKFLRDKLRSKDRKLMIANEYNQQNEDLEICKLIIERLNKEGVLTSQVRNYLVKCMADHNYSESEFFSPLLNRLTQSPLFKSGDGHRQVVLGLLGELIEPHYSLEDFQKLRKVLPHFLEDWTKNRDLFKEEFFHSFFGPNLIQDGPVDIVELLEEPFLAFMDSPQLTRKKDKTFQNLVVDSQFNLRSFILGSKTLGQLIRKTSRRRTYTVVGDSTPNMTRWISRKPSFLASSGQQVEEKPIVLLLPWEGKPSITFLKVLWLNFSTQLVVVTPMGAFRPKTWSDMTKACAVPSELRDESGRGQKGHMKMLRAWIHNEIDDAFIIDSSIAKPLIKQAKNPAGYRSSQNTLVITPQTLEHMPEALDGFMEKKKPSNIEILLDNIDDFKRGMQLIKKHSGTVKIFTLPELNNNPERIFAAQNTLSSLTQLEELRFSGFGTIPVPNSPFFPDPTNFPQLKRIVIKKGEMSNIKAIYEWIANFPRKVELVLDQEFISHTKYWRGSSLATSNIQKAIPNISQLSLFGSHWTEQNVCGTLYYCLRKESPLTKLSISSKVLRAPQFDASIHPYLTESDVDRDKFRYTTFDRLRDSLPESHLEELGFRLETDLDDLLDFLAPFKPEKSPCDQETHRCLLPFPKSLKRIQVTSKGKLIRSKEKNIILLANIIRSLDVDVEFDMDKNYTEVEELLSLLK